MADETTHRSEARDEPYEPPAVKGLGGVEASTRMPVPISSLDAG